MPGWSVRVVRFEQSFVSSQISGGAMSSSRKNKTKRKHCNCSSTCGKPLAGRTRREHYRRIEDKSTILPSESEYSSSDEEMAGYDDDNVVPDDPMDTFTSVDALTAHSIMDVDNDTTDDNDSDPVLSDAESEFVLEEEDEWLKFDEGEERDEYVSREEMDRELEEMLGSDEEAELWEYSAYLVWRNYSRY
jgi:hypothetical protein